MKLKKIALTLAIVLCALSWIAVGIGFAMDLEKSTFIVIVTTAAITTELLFWAVAFAFGLSIFESRRKLINWVKNRLGITTKNSSGELS